MTTAARSVLDGTVYHNFIDGQWLPSVSGDLFENRNPANTDDLIGVFQKSTRQDVECAIDAARRAYAHWRLVPAPRRAEILFRAAQLLSERKEALARDMTREMGKVLDETRGDVQEAIDMTYFMAGEGRRLHGQTAPSELRDKFAMSVRQPLGVCAVITPWNFPMAIPSWKIFPALMAGNAVVFKPASDTPIVATKLVEILEEAGLPGGVLNLVTGSGKDVGDVLVKDPRIQGISFTGSTDAGRHIAEIAGRNLKRLGLELGGKNAIVVLDDADLPLAVDGALWAAFGTSGQRCTAASRLIVDRKVAVDFVDLLQERAAKMKVGDGLQPDTDMGPVINEAALKKVHEYTEIGKKEHARLVHGGDFAGSEGWFYRPTIFADGKKDMRMAQEEIFGPSTLVLPVDNLEEALEVANSTQYGLSMSIYTNDLRKAFHAMDEMQSGIVYVNAPTIGAEIQLPFGGVKNTGNGHREAGTVALDEFTEWKTIYVDYSGRLQRAQIDTGE
ncbi:MAG: alpha-ketoglutaric semialdehyde dehydrogenase [Chloroflexota bacterium]|nr:alpha-ketoglutaric semialdehyde dehydrogenase [Chloroflexota bacterium]